VRADRETWVHHASYVGAMGKLALAPSMHMRWLPQSEYGQEERIPINLLVVWKRGFAQPWLLATSLTDPNLSLLYLGHKPEVVAEMFAVAASTIQNWHWRYRSSGCPSTARS
jgi:hypothetical protein